MADLQLVHYIEKEQEKGYSEHQVREILMKFGTPKEAIEECFSYIKAKEKDEHMQTYSSEQFLDAEQKEEAAAQQQKSTTPVYQQRNMYVIAGIIMLIIIGSFFVMKVTFFNENNDNSSKTADDDSGLTGSSKNTGIVNNNTGMKSIITPDRLKSSESARQELFNKLVDECVEADMKNADETCLALGSDDVAKCSGDPDCSDDFYLYNAIAADDSSICEKIIQEEHRQACMIALEKDPAKCASLLEGNELAYCEAVLSQDMERCWALEGENLQNKCWTNIRVTKALSEQDPSYCSRIKNYSKGTRNNCLASVNKDTGACANKPGCEAKAYFNIARITRDAAECEKITDETTKNDCRSEISETT